MLNYPAIDPIIFTVGPLSVRWYGVSYVIAFAAAWLLGRWRAARPGSTWQPEQVDDLVFYSAIGAILGGRLGWILFYGTSRLVEDPLVVFKIWQGGMSFHGGISGVLIATALLARRQGRPIADMFDFMAPLPCLGILAGRLANFVNGELWGKPTTVPWGFVIDPTKLKEAQADEALRLCSRFDISPCVLQLHASQLYEGLLEGLLTFIILWTYTARPRPRLAPTGLFLVCYACSRLAVEFVRVPDEDPGYLWFGWVTMGQVLTLPMLIAGVSLLVIAYRRNQVSGNIGPIPQAQRTAA
jgi:phosphatidylglycerol---prolipoprotein diacylglyceryl transferase